LSKNGKLGDQEIVNLLVEDRAIEMQYCDPATSKPSEGTEKNDATKFITENRSMCV
jgi:hypothetical protein